MSQEFDMNAYLERINYNGEVDATYETLYNLHVAHTLNVPFENLDVFFRRPILLDKDSLFKKIVEDQRGGYCFEMNGLFAFVLEELGFKVTNLLARGTRDGGITYTAKVHQVLMVEIDEKKWLVDVGYGMNGLTAPLLLETGVDQKQFTHTYRLIENPKGGYILQNKIGNDYIYMYAFTLDECSPMDYLMSNHFTATFPESFFIQMKMCTMPTEQGRITLTDQHFKVIENGEVTETELLNDEEYNKYLKEHFKLDLDLIK